MKKFFAVLGLALVSVQGFASSLNDVAWNDFFMTSLTASIQDVINWKVGDTSSFDVAAGSFGKMGTMVKSVTKDEGTALWLHQDMNLSVQKQVADVLINKADGKILKMIVDGKEQAIPDDKIEVISQDYTEITVPAGTFKAVHVVAKSKQISKLEVWANPRDTVMEGTLKQIANTGLFDLVLELTSFKKMP
ncbi:hypothetical protein WDW86_11045 [Bdellovibrionota bacterium FG-2]